MTEENSNIRTASFQVLIELAEREQIVYAAHYDILNYAEKWLDIYAVAFADAFAVH